MYIFNTPENKKAVFKLCCDVCNVPMTEVMSKTRKRKYMTPKQIACKIYKDNMLLSLKEIGFIVSYKPQHHASVISSIRVTNNMLDTNDEEFCTYYNQIMKCLFDVIKLPNKMIITYQEGFPVDKIVNFLKTKKNVHYEFEAS
jgi:hypothetical protein